VLGYVVILRLEKNLSFFMAQGKIRVQTENIFPIIKKFLYSDQDIFIRELVSNAIDACNKLKKLSAIGEAKGELGDLAVRISIDEEKKTLTISDNGLGMTAEEVDKYINQVAFSGAEEFIEKYKGDDTPNIIGHFGLGFYSSFMVSKEVEILTKSHTDAPAARWICDGSPEYTLEENTKATRGTDIVLHLNDESVEYASEDKIKSIIKKFGSFLPLPVFVGEEQLNNVNPIWVRKPSELTDEDYINFYKELYPFAEAPLFWIHLNVEYPFELTGVLYFPKIKNSYEIQKDKIQLYCSQVFVTDEVKDIVPEFLMHLHGIIDSPDIPLNVSRSYLQGDPNVKKINAHITKKVADKLEELYKKDRENYDAKWESLELFVKYGMMTDDKFAERGNKFLLMNDLNAEKLISWEDYKMGIEALQKNKDGKLVVIYTSDKVAQDSFIAGAKAQNYSVVQMDSLIDNAFVSNMEMKWSDVHFARVDSELPENLIDKKENSDSVLSSDDTEKVKNLFAVSYDGITINVDVHGASTDAVPVTASQPEQMRRMKEMASMGGGMMSFYGSLPNQVTLSVNGNHKIIADILKMDNTAQASKVRQLADLAMLNLGMLKGKELTQFVERSYASL
jgi:molecular chaperone HtpG